MMTPDKSTTIIENTIPDLLDALGCGLSRGDLCGEYRCFEISGQALAEAYDGLCSRVAAAVRPSFEMLFMDLLDEKGVLDEYLENDDPEAAGLHEEEFRRMVTENGAALLRDRLPALPGLVCGMSDRYREVLREMLARLCGAYEDVCRELLGRRFTVVTGIDTGSGDMHNYGRSTTLITTDAGRLVYKPHDVMVDHLTGEFIKEFFAAYMQAPKVLPYDGYGFAEFVANDPAGDEETAEKYYRNLGGLTAMVQVLGSYDMHHANVLARGEYPVIIDFETMIAPGAGPEAAGLRKDIGYSLLYSSLMPMRRGDIESSILFARDERNPSAPVVDGRRLSVTDHPDEFLAGFTEAYTRALARRDEIKAFIRESFSGVIIRHVYRNTGVYSQMIDRTHEPGWLGSAELGAEIYKGLSLALRRGGFAGNDETAHAETEAILRGDIPYLYVMADGRDLYADGRVVHRDFFPGSSIENVLARIGHLGEDDLRFEKALLSKAMTRIMSRSSDAEDAQALPDDPEMLSDEELIAAAEDIFRQLASDAVCTPSGELIWFGPDYNLRTGMELLDMGLMRGNSGLAVFFAALGTLTDDGDIRRSCAELTGSIGDRLERSIKSLEALDVIYPNRENISLSSGLAGKLMASYLLWKYTEDERYDLLCRDIVSAMCRLELGYERLDVYNGISGALRLLTANDYLFTQPGAEELCGKLADRLLRSAGIGYRGSFIWKTSSVNWPISGAGHGQSGVASALYAAGKRLGRDDLIQAASAGFGFERDIYSPALGAWPDRRVSRDSEAHMSGICSGAPGIGLDALRTGYEGSEEMLSLATDSVMKEPLLDKDSLCCGNSAIVEFLLSAGQGPGREDLRDEARRRLSQVKARAGEKGQYHCLKKGISHMFSPGLYYGVAGIGYEMLRAAAPEMVQSVFV